jgi:hypothetical protein
VHVSRKSSAPSIGLANVRLHLSVLRDIQVEHLGGRTNKYGQFVFAVDEARDDPDELFERAQAADQMGDMAKAERFQACAASGLSGARDEFDPAAIVQNLKTLVLRTIDQPPLRGGTQRPVARSGLVGGWNTRVFFSHTEAPRLVRNAGLHRIRCPETQRGVTTTASGRMRPSVTNLQHPRCTCPPLPRGRPRSVERLRRPRWRPSQP